MKFRKKCTVLMFASIFMFTIAMVFVFCVKGSVPDGLIVAFFAFWAAEGGAMAWIKNTDTKNQKKKKPAEKRDDKEKNT